MDSGDVRAGIWIEEDRLVVIQETVVVGFRSVVGKEPRMIYPAHDAQEG
jgi:hypothetical protein